MSKIPALGQSMSKEGKEVFVLNRGDLTRKVMDLHLKDYGLKTTQLPPSPDILFNLEGPIIDIQREDPSKRYYPDLRKSFFSFPPDKFGGAGIPTKYFEPPKPLNLPGGVSMEEFAKSWVDNGDWPLSIQFVLGYGGIISLMR